MSHIIRQWNGRTIRQREDGYLSATDMCQAVGKLFADWMRLKSTTEYLQALEVDMGIPISELAQIQKGGIAEAQGAWIHPEPAVDLAQWLNVQLRIQVNRWTVELMTHGKVEIQSGQSQPQLTPIQETIASVDALVSWIAQTDTEKNLLEQAKYDAVANIHPEYRPLLEAAKKVRSTEAIHSSVGMTATQVGEKLTPRMSAVKLNRILEEMGLQYRDFSGKKPVWQLTDEGKEYGFVYFASNEDKWSGDQIRWQNSVIAEIQDYLDNAAA